MSNVKTGFGVELFSLPDKHPFGMLPGVTHGCEHESVLTYMLTQCVKAGDWIPVEINDFYGTLQREGLVDITEDFKYLLTEKAKGLLYGYYRKSIQSQK